VIPSRRDVLLGALAAGLAGTTARAATAPRRLVVLHCDGGWDTTFTFDPKPGIDSVAGPGVDADLSNPLDQEEIGQWGEIEVTLNAARRNGVTRYFDDWGHRTTVVRGLWVGTVSHWIGRDRILCGTEVRGAPDLTSIVGATVGGPVLGMVDLSGNGRFGAASSLGARAGQRGQLRGLLLPSSRFATASGAARPAEHSPGMRAQVDAWLQQSATAEIAGRIEEPSRAVALNARTQARARGRALAAQAGTLDPVLPAGARDLQDQVLLAVELLAAGTCQSVLIDSAQHWDTHASHVDQHFSQHATFSGLRILVEGLEAAGLLDDTLVVVLSEMGRTPWRNADGGTEHWPYTGALLVGGGVAGGRVIGATDDHLIGQPIDTANGVLDAGGAVPRFDQFAAAVLHQVGIDPGDWLPGVVPLGGLRA